MLYFIGYTDRQNNWTGNFTHAVRNALAKREIPFQELPPYDWYATNAPIGYYLGIESKPEDIWFIDWAQSPIIELIRNKPGRKYGLVVGLTAMPFDPSVLWERTAYLREKESLCLYDKIFAVSYWCQKCLYEAYSNLKDKVAVTGFPFDFKIYICRLPKKKAWLCLTSVLLWKSYTSLS